MLSCLVAALLPTMVVAQPPSPSSSASPSTSAGPVVERAVDPPAAEQPVPVPERPEISALKTVAARVRALIAGTLELGVDPSSLFDVSIRDPGAVRIEVERLRAVVAWADRIAALQAVDEPEIPDALPDAGAAVLDAGAEETADAGTEALEPSLEYAELKDLDPELWEARIELDRSRLAFYELPEEERERILGVHDERRREDANAESAKQLDEVERKTNEVEEERKRALEAIERAATEAARLVAEERARLLTVAKEQAEFEGELVKQDQAIVARGERWLLLQRRVKDALELGKARKADPAEVDSLYDELRIDLGSGRDELSEVIGALTFGDSKVPTAGDDPLASLPAEVDRSKATEVRNRVERATETLRAAERASLRERASKLNEEVAALDEARRSLLKYLSPEKRDAVTGLGPTGLDQAFAEIRQVTLVLRYHATASKLWLEDLQDPNAKASTSAVAVGFVALKWALAIGAFMWWRRRADRTLEGLVERLREESTEAKRRATGAADPLSLRAVSFFRRVRRPAEWLLLIWVLTWLLPLEARGILEVELPQAIAVWLLGGALGVQTLDYLAGEDSARRRRQSRLLTAHIRLRSLRLVGRTVVVFGLILALSSRLVGKGTIYDWAFTLCWLSALPVGLILVKWWRAVIFERVGLKRRKSALDDWIVNNREGWKSLVAAILGGVTLLSSGVYRVARTWVSTFDVTRRVLAYLFRRGMSKHAEVHSKIRYRPLQKEVYEQLGPAIASEKIVPSVADQQVEDVINRIDAAGGGVFAVVGERGAGKTTLLKRIAERANDVTLVRCPHGGIRAFAPVFLEAMGKEDVESIESVAAEFDAADRDAGILVDNAHRLILPMMGGLKHFDRILDIARRHSDNVSWVFAFDDVIWRLFEQLRGSKPLFDDVIRLKPWSEETIATLLTNRSTSAGIDPTFENLLEELPSDADELDREDALESVEANYYRLIWDYAAGNPGVALHVWRNSLGLGEEDRVLVKLFEAPDTHELEALPDPAVFVLRAIVQLDGALPEDIVRATNLSPTEIADALRYGTVHGYFRKSGDRYRITWVWFRAITRFLQRRHLLAEPR